MKFKNQNAFSVFINSLGGKAYLVGGSVRDMVLGREPKDSDYCVTGLNESDLPFFDKVIGKDFPVFQIEIAGKKCGADCTRDGKKSLNGL